MINSKDAKTMILKTSKQYIKDIKKIKFSLVQKTLLNIYVNALKNKVNFPASAKVKKLRGEWLGYSSFCLGYDLRVIFKRYEEVELVRIGTHNQLYKYK